MDYFLNIYDTYLFLIIYFEVIFLHFSGYVSLFLSI